MVYFAHGVHLARFRQPLIAEEIQAWAFGPVIPSIYDQFKSFGISSIVFEDPNLDIKLLELTPSAIDVIDYTFEVTKKVSAMALSNWTHLPNSPWSKYYGTEYNAPIENSVMEEYFRLEVLKQQ